MNEEEEEYIDYNRVSLAQIERMRRRMRMKEIENIKFKRIDNLRAAIADIHESRESKALLDKDDTPYSQPVLQSLQAIVGLELSKDIKTFNGTETVNLNSSLLDIPLIEETVEEHKQFNEKMWNNRTLLEMSRIKSEVGKLDKRREKLVVSLHEEEVNGKLKELLCRATSRTFAGNKQPVKQSSISNRIMRFEKGRQRKENAKEDAIKIESLIQRQQDILKEYQQKDTEHKTLTQLDSSIDRNKMGLLSPRLLKQDGNQSEYSMTPNKVIRKNTSQLDEKQSSRGSFKTEFQSDSKKIVTHILRTQHSIKLVSPSSEDRHQMIRMHRSKKDVQRGQVEDGVKQEEQEGGNQLGSATELKDMNRIKAHSNSSLFRQDLKKSHSNSSLFLQDQRGSHSNSSLFRKGCAEMIFLNKETSEQMDDLEQIREMQAKKQERRCHLMSVKKKLGLTDVFATKREDNLKMIQRNLAKLNKEQTKLAQIVFVPLKRQSASSRKEQNLQAVTTPVERSHRKQSQLEEKEQNHENLITNRRDQQKKDIRTERITFKKDFVCNTNSTFNQNQDTNYSQTFSGCDLSPLLGNRQLSKGEITSFQNVKINKKGKSSQELMRMYHNERKGISNGSLNEYMKGTDKLKSKRTMMSPETQVLVNDEYSLLKGRRIPINISKEKPENVKNHWYFSQKMSERTPSPSDYMKNYFNKKVQYNKEMGEPITSAHKITLKCKQKVHNFFTELMNYQETNQQDNSLINQQLTNDFNVISQELLIQKEGFLGKQQNYEKNMVNEVLKTHFMIE